MGELIDRVADGAQKEGDRQPDDLLRIGPEYSP